MFKCTDCTSRRPGLDSQYPHGGYQLSVTLVADDPTCSSGLFGNTVCVHGAQTYAGKMPINTK